MEPAILFKNVSSFFSAAKSTGWNTEQEVQRHGLVKQYGHRLLHGDLV